MIVAPATISPENVPGTWPVSASSVMSPVSEESVVPSTEMLDDVAVSVEAAAKAVAPETFTSGTHTPVDRVIRTSK